MVWKKIQVKKATRIATDNFRIQAAILEYEDCKLLLINTYFPCDSQKLELSNDEATELQNLLSTLHDIKNKYATKFDTSIVLGDINFDDTRYTGHTLAVNNFLENERLCSVWDSFPVDFTFSAGKSFSTIDHFFISNTQQDIIFEAGAIHDPENMSGHSPVYLKINLAKANNPPEKIFRNPRLNWCRSSPDQKASYTQQVKDLLSEPEPEPVCLQCDDVLCSHRSHLQEIDSLTQKLISAMVDSAWDNLEATKGTTGDQVSREHTIPGMIR